MPKSTRPNSDTLLERIIVLEQSIKAAHHRVDKMDEGVREDLRDMKNQFSLLTQELKGVIAWMNRSKGWAAGAMLLASVIGGGISLLFK